MRPLLLATLFLLACAHPDKGRESDVPEEDKADAQRRPTEHGLLPPGGTAYASLSAESGLHAYEVVLDGEATLSIATGPPSEGTPEVDTVLYLYRRGARGWGSPIARDDDSGGTRWSRMQARVGTGRYRILVKGYTRWTRGAFALSLGCEGPGCPTPPPACLFGATFYELPSQPGLVIVGREKITATEGLDALTQAQLMLAVQQSSHTEVTSAAEALACVDEAEVNRVLIDETTGPRHFVAYEYGAGDNSYGAIFPLAAATVLASIHDGDLVGCTVSSP